MIRRLQRWLEYRGWAPSYGGSVLLGLTLFFFLAGTNTLSGWLFVMCGVSLALLMFSLRGKPWRSLKAVIPDIAPVSVGEALAIPVQLTAERPCQMLQVELAFGTQTLRYALDQLQGRQTVFLQVLPARRGLYQWENLTLRSAAPLGIWWKRQDFLCPQSVIVYPQILPIQNCPLLAASGQDTRDRDRSSQSYDAMQGYTRALRPYRRGDPMRLIHWRSSARYGELRTRELEAVGSGAPLLIAIDHRPGWVDADFEAALVVASSLYAWGKRQDMALGLWTDMGAIAGDRLILSTLATLMPTARAVAVPTSACLWLTCDPTSLNHHVWLGWGNGHWQGTGRRIDPEQDLSWQLQHLLPIEYC